MVTGTRGSTMACVTRAICTRRIKLIAEWASSEDPNSAEKRVAYGQHDQVLA